MKKHKKKYELSYKAFTLVEALVYIAILIVVILSISMFFAWAIRSNTKAKVMRETLYNAERAMAVMIYEIKEARGIYSPTGIFNSHPGQLSLETIKYLPQGEETSYLDFYLCDKQLCIKKESRESSFITSSNVEITNLVFSEIISEQALSVEIDLTIRYKNPQNRPEYSASVSLKSTASLVLY